MVFLEEVNRPKENSDDEEEGGKITGISLAGPKTPDYGSRHKSKENSSMPPRKSKADSTWTVSGKET